MGKALGYKPFLEKLIYLATAENSAYKEEAWKAWQIVEDLANDYETIEAMEVVAQRHKWNYNPTKKIYAEGRYVNVPDVFWDVLEGIKRSIRKELNTLKKNWRKLKRRRR